MKAVSNQSRSFAQFSQRPDERQAKQNLFDLSHDVKTTFSMGQLIPFLTLETLPGDNFTLDFEAMIRFAPLYLPIMHRCDLTVNYFYVTNRILWGQIPQGQSGGVLASIGSWQDYITQNQDLINPYFLFPVDQINNGKAYSLLDYMGYPTDNITGGGSDITNVSINMLPFAAFWKIYDEYYRNPQVEPIMSAGLQSGENDIVDWPNYYGDVISDHGLFVPYKLWNRDYFTSCLPTPQVGAEVLIPMYNPDMDFFTGVDEPSGPFRWRLRGNESVPPTESIPLVTRSTDSPTGRSRIDGSDVFLDIQETAATMRQFRLAARMLEFLERLMRIGTRYRDFLKGQFGVDPDPGTIDLPVYLGGSKGRVIISEVMSTAETTDAPIGQYAGQALAIESGKSKIQYKCKEHGFIIGIINIQPRSSYMQGLSKMWTRGVGSTLRPGSVYDYAFEQFSAIGDQPVYYKELRYDYNNVAANINHNEDTFGYIPRYSEYRWHNDIVSGQMRTIWQSFHLGRIFTQVPATALTEPVLNREFITCRPRVDDVFQIGASQDHEIYAHIFNNIQVWRNLPKFGIPHL